MKDHDINLGYSAYAVRLWVLMRIFRICRDNTFKWEQLYTYSQRIANSPRYNINLNFLQYCTIVKGSIIKTVHGKGGVICKAGENSEILNYWREVIHHREDWLIYRGAFLLSYDSAPRTPPSPLSRQEIVSFSKSSFVSPVQFIDGRGGGGGGGAGVAPNPTTARKLGTL
jgi:hypothetical protein